MNIVHRAIRRALERDLKIFAVVLGAEALLAALLSVALRSGYLNILNLMLLATGFLILVVSAIEGLGASEWGLVQNPVYKLSSSYQEAVVNGRLAREQENFWFMIVGFLFGVSFLVVAVLMGLLSTH